MHNLHTRLARCTTGSSPLLRVQFHSIVTLARPGLNNVIKVNDGDNHRQNQTMAQSQLGKFHWPEQQWKPELLIFDLKKPHLSAYKHTFLSSFFGTQ